jgi:hypothetical protein
MGRHLVLAGVLLIGVWGVATPPYTGALAIITDVVILMGVTVAVLGWRKKA